MNLESLNRWLGPPLSLGAGMLTVLFLRRGALYAPVAVALVLGGWWLAAVVPLTVGRLSQRLQDRLRLSTPLRRDLLSLFLRSLVAGLYQNVLFFLVPLWFSSATWASANIAFPLLLALMAVFSCIEPLCRPWVLERPIPRCVWSAVILFAALIPAAPLVADVPLRLAIAAAAALSTLAAVLSRRDGRTKTRRLRFALLGAAAAAGAGGLFFFSAPLLPPVPVQCPAKALGTDVAERSIVGASQEFDAGVERVYAWFAVAAPGHYRHKVRFAWYREGERIGRPFETESVGGRRGGFRTWSYFPRPWPGSWRVELRSDAGQLIAEQSFTVIP